MSELGSQHEGEHPAGVFTNEQMIRVSKLITWVNGLSIY